MFKSRQTGANALFWGSCTIIAVMGLLVASAVAGGREPLVGPHPWDFPERSRETSFAYQYARDNAQHDNLGAAAGIAGAFGSTLIINSSTTAVGNWQQIEMTLGDGAEGLIMTENHQDNSGAASAETRTLDGAVLVTETVPTASTGHFADGHNKDRGSMSDDGEMSRTVRGSRDDTGRIRGDETTSGSEPGLDSSWTVRNDWSQGSNDRGENQVCGADTGHCWGSAD